MPLSVQEIKTRLQIVFSFDFGLRSARSFAEVIERKGELFDHTFVAYEVH